MSKAFSIDKNGVEYIDTGEDGMLDELNAALQAQDRKNMEKSDSLRDRRMAGLPTTRRRKK